MANSTPYFSSTYHKTILGAYLRPALESCPRCHIHIHATNAPTSGFKWRVSALTISLQLFVWIGLIVTPLGGV